MYGTSALVKEYQLNP